MTGNLSISSEVPLDDGGRADEGTVVVSDILEPATWTLNNSPYILLTEIYQFSVVDLVIEPGVEVIFKENGSIISDGNIIAKGTPENKITFRTEDIYKDIYHVIGFTEWTTLDIEYCRFIDIDPIRIVGTDNLLFEKCDFYGTTSFLIDNATCGCPFSTVKNVTVRDSFFYDCPRAFRMFNDSDFEDPNRVYGNEFHNSSVVYEMFYEDASPVTHTVWHDGNGLGNYWNDYAGEDLDGDGTGDTNVPWKGADSDPLMKPPGTDSDSDGTEDTLDPDDDNDGYADSAEAKAGTDPFDENDYPNRPVWSTIEDIELSPGNETVTIDLADYATDADQSDKLVFSLIDHFTESIQVTLAGTKLKVVYIADSESSIWVRVTDGIFDVDANITVKAKISGIVVEDTDKDDDGIEDSWEELYFGDLLQEPSGDPDGDYLTNLKEYQGGTDPTVMDISADSDNDQDGLPDQWEVDHFSSLEPLPGQDGDGDGLTNAQELNLGTDPAVYDAQGEDEDDTGSIGFSDWYIFAAAGILIILVIIIAMIFYLVVFKDNPRDEDGAADDEGEEVVRRYYGPGAPVSAPESPPKPLSQSGGRPEEGGSPIAQQVEATAGEEIAVGNEKDGDGEMRDAEIDEEIADDDLVIPDLADIFGSDIDEE